MAKAPVAATHYTPRVTEERTLAEIKQLLERPLEYPVDYLPSEETPSASAFIASGEE